MANEDGSTEIETPEQDVQEVIETPAVPEAKNLEDQIEALAAADTSAKGDKTVETPAPVEGEPPVEGDPAAAAEFKPNFKFKVLEEELEIDEMFRPLIKTKEDEDKVREIMEKAHGIDHIKQDRDRFRDDFNTHKEALTKQTTAINQLSGYLDNKDYDAFFDALEIPKAEIMKYALLQAQKDSWTPEQKQTHNDNLQAKRRANIYQDNYNTSQTELDSLRQDQVVKDFTLELFRPEVREFQEAFDQRNGKDAFRTEVAQLGEFNEKVHNKILPVGELIGSVMKKFGPWMKTAGPAAQQTAQTQTVAPRELPTIPNTGSAGQVPATKAIKSLADLEAIADSL